MIALLAAVVIAGCGGEPLEFADWTIPVPEETRVIEYAPVPDEERTERIEFVEDLVIGSDDQDANQRFYQPRAVAVDASGSIYVLDSGNRQIQVFDVDGSFVTTMGGEGQGPGEFLHPTQIAVAGNHVVVYDEGGRKLSVWTLGGEHEGDRGVTTFRGPWRIAGTDDGQLRISYLDSLDTGSRIYSVGTFTVDGEKVRDLGRFRVPPEVVWRGERPPAVTAPVPQPYFALSGAGVVYVPGDYLYQVVAVSEAGESLWALRVAGTWQPFPRSYVERTETMLKEWYPGIPTSEFLWPERSPAFADVEVDGHGHLYVFPWEDTVRAPGMWSPATAAAATQDKPVDVYSADGERIFTGYFPARGAPYREWEAARSDFVYRTVEFDESGGTVIVRYRLIEPF